MRCAVTKIGKSEPAAYHFSRNVASSAVWDLRLRKPFTSAIAPRSRVRRRRVVRAELQGQGMRNRYCWYNQKLVLPIEDISGQLFPAQLHPAPQTRHRQSPRLKPDAPPRCALGWRKHVVTHA